MNRRELLKALVGGVVVALVPNLPRVEEELDVAVLQGALVRIADSAMAVVPSLQELATSAREAGKWLYVPDPEVRSEHLLYDQGQLVASWEDDWHWELIKADAQRIDHEIMNS